jgi:hypothetical protein
MELAHQTDIAMSHCTGDWLFYIQSDEVIHEDDLPVLKKLMQDNLSDTSVEGILFDYIHFWGDYNHQRVEHGWYKKEIRIVKPIADIHSWRDAQSFRVMPNFDGKDYYRKENTRKIGVIDSKCRVFHYGWVRPPSLMVGKVNTWFQHIAGGSDDHKRLHEDAVKSIYGYMNDFALYTGTHPKIMENRIAMFNWTEELDFKGKYKVEEQLKKRFITFLEQKIFKRPLFEFKNYNKVK